MAWAFTLREFCDILALPLRNESSIMKAAHSSPAFTLVELSIVLVIIGLLTGGILAGQSLIRAAELKAVTTEFDKYVSATQAFRDKYQALPGDMNNASSFWTAIPAADNGNGNGIIDGASAALATGENFQFWNELALAGLIEGSYSGVAGPAAPFDHVIGNNCPKSKVTNAGWGVQNLANFPAGDAAWYAFDYGNAFAFGSRLAGSVTQNVALKPEEAWNIDTKIDDGKPLNGKVIAINYATCTTTAAGAASASGDPNTDIYKLSDSGIDCALAFAKPF